MAENNKHDDQRELAAHTPLGQVGFKSKLKSLAALDSLLASWFDSFGYRPQRQLLDSKRNLELQGRLLKIENDRIVEWVKRNSNYNETPDGRAAFRLMRKQLATEQVIAEAAVALSDVELNEDASLPSQDWLNCFTSYTDNISEPEIRSLWANLLASEIKTKRSFSKTTLRVLSEMDTEAAQLFSGICRYYIQELNGVTKPDELDGESFRNMALLEEKGLVHSVGGQVRYLMVRRPDGNYYLRNGAHALRLSPAIEPMSIQLIPFTSAGLEVSTLIEKAPEIDSLKRVFHDVEKSVINAHIVFLDHIADEKYNPRVLEQLK